MAVVLALKSTSITTWVLALLIVCLRLVARRLSKSGFWYDDWLMIPAPLFSAALCFNSVVLLPNPEVDLKNDVIQRFLTTELVCDICWVVVMWIVKFSILAFYWRLFSARSRSLRVIIWALVVLVTCWGIIVVLIRAICGLPYSSAHKCAVPLGWYLLGCPIPNIITDVVLLGLPVPLIWSIDMHRTQKISLTAVFALGSLVTIISIIRLIYLTNEYNAVTILTPGQIDTFMWTTVEANTSIICACLPCLRPVLSLISAKLKLLRNRKSIHKKGVDLLMDMVPARKVASPLMLPLSRQQSHNDGPHPMLDSSAYIEVEANNPRNPELGAEAPGPHFVEAETVETILEMYSQGPVGELEGYSHYMSEQ